MSLTANNIALTFSIPGSSKILVIFKLLICIIASLFLSSSGKIGLIISGVIGFVSMSWGKAGFIVLGNSIFLGWITFISVSIGVSIFFSVSGSKVWTEEIWTSIGSVGVWVGIVTWTDEVENWTFSLLINFCKIFSTCLRKFSSTVTTWAKTN